MNQLIPVQPLVVIPINHTNRAAATIVAAVGAAIQTLTSALPGLVAHFPGAHWIPQAVFSLGIAWLAIQRINDAITQDQIAASRAQP